MRRKARKWPQNKSICYQMMMIHKMMHTILRWIDLNNCLLVYMLKCILILSQQSGSSLSCAFFLKSWNVNVKFPLILRISNYAYVWISLKHLFINKNKIKHYLFFQGLNPDQYVSVQQIRLLYPWWSKQDKDSTLKEPSKKDDFPIDSIQMEIKKDVWLCSWYLGCSYIWESKVFRFHWRWNS